ncbi:MAG: ATP-binding protein [Myxococcota bacterium]|nr:ATP-binding protein [Myxococcota bacterium]
MKILIADDSRTERLILSAQLRKWGYEFVLASSGEEALKIMLSPGHPKLAILDWVMPGLTGPEVVQYIRKKMKDDYVYCILVTSLGSKEDIIEGLRSGADDYITKPVHSGELKVRLRAAERLLEAWSAIADSEKKTRSILDSAGDAVILISPEGLINYANPQAEALLCQVGTSPLGTSFYDYLASPEEQHEAQQKLQQLINDGGSPGSGGRFELNLRGADGHMSTVSLGAAPLRNAQTQAISIFMTDISEQRRLEVQLQHAQKLEAVGQLAAGIAHEINTPIQFVGDSITYLQQSFEDIDLLVKTYETTIEALPEGTLSTDQLDDLEDAREEADLEYQRTQVPRAFGRTQEGLDRVTRIVRAMKEFSRKDATLGMEPADLNRAIESTLTVAQNEYRYIADIELQLHDLPPVQCNLGDLNQVFLNLIVNASHAISAANNGSDGRGLITVRTEREGSDWVKIQISDTGTGIPSGVQKRIFEPFFTTKEVGKGTGQGLAIAHSMVVEKHKGTLDFETEEGKGTTFVIRLPIEGIEAHATA